MKERDLKVGQKLVTALGTSIVIVKITPKTIRTQFENGGIMSYGKKGKPYKRLLKDNQIETI